MEKGRARAGQQSQQEQQQQGEQLRPPGVKRLLVIGSAIAYVVFLGQ
jgi:hypothetical protein